MIVNLQARVKVSPHLFKAFIGLNPPLDFEMLIQQCSVQAFDNAVALGAAGRSPAVFDILKLQEKLEWVPIHPPAAIGAVVGEDGNDGAIMFLKEG